MEWKGFSVSEKSLRQNGIFLLFSVRLGPVDVYAFSCSFFFFSRILVQILLLWLLFMNNNRKV